ncbi:MAG: cupredoxin domain-containing protein [Nitrososphaeraceae archaeon]
MTLLSAHNVYAQFGMFPIQTPNAVQPTYIIDIQPGAALKDNTQGYFPQNISIPSGTTIAWFNDDPGQPHTVTSGLNSNDIGKEFNSGIIPYSAFFMYTFDKPGMYVYHDSINPSLTGSIYVSSAYELGHNFKFSAGTDLKSEDDQYVWTFDKSEHDRILLNFEPTTIIAEDTTPVTYNLTIFKDDAPIYSKSFFSLGNVFQVELIDSNTNQTTVYGPDFTDPITGAYHIEMPLSEGKYTLRAEIIAVGKDIPEKEIFDEFKGIIIS